MPLSPSRSAGGGAHILACGLSLAAASSRGGRSRLGPWLRGAARAAIVASVAVPLLRKRLRLHPAATVAATIAGPVATATLRRRTKARDAVIFAQQMWAFTMIHELPYDDPAALRRRLRIRYPIRCDRALGRGRLPNTRLQRALTPADGSVTALDRLLSFAHWAWFFEPHLSLLYVLVRDEGRFARAARQMGAAFDLGCAVYIALPTAPPWWAAANGYTGEDPVERRMLAVGEETFRAAWPRMYDTVDGNPWAAMPSLHFGASVLAAILLSESSRTAGAFGWTYAGVLGFALVYLGEHYVVDLIAGLGLVAAVRLGEPPAEPLALAVSRAVQGLERAART
ncbi:MAG: phosphatase PAP2 family protein [Thermoleophilia bacterium]|nr:phosphatase PAP2 family protein [Thermoleophilia bacterium]